MQTVVEHEVQVRLVLTKESDVAVTARLRYTACDPYAVKMAFRLGCEPPVTWTFSRELLVEGMRQPCGHGDVRIWPISAPGKSTLCIALTSPEGDALLEAPPGLVAAWLQETLRAVPAGEESDRLAMDEGLTELFTSSSLKRLLPEGRGKLDEGSG